MSKETGLGQWDKNYGVTKGNERLMGDQLTARGEMVEHWSRRNGGTLESEKHWSRRNGGTLESEKWWNIATLESEKEHWSRRNSGT